MHKKVVIFPYIPAMVIKVEKWLEQMAEDNWHLVDVNGWLFVFETGKSKSRNYFMYSGFDLSKGFSYIFLHAKDKYQIRDSKLNKRNRSIFEVDPNKIDERFYQIRKQRDKFYKNHYLKLIIFSLICCLVLFPIIICTLSKKLGVIIITIWYILLLLYSTLSFVYLSVKSAGKNTEQKVR